MKRYRHTMVIGGTGMLRDASAELALRSDTMTSVARTTRSLDALNAVIHRETDHHRVALDWREPMLFLQAIAQHLEHRAPPDLVLAWVHNDELTLELARALAPNRCAFYHVIGSASRNPLAIAASCVPDPEISPTLSYRQVVLGHMKQNGGRRWLTHAEISAGTIAATQRGMSRYIVGSVDQPFHGG